VEAAVNRALEKLPADRFQTAALFAEALARPGAATAPPATAARPAPRAPTLRGRARTLVPWAAGVAALAAGLALGLRLAQRETPRVVRMSMTLPTEAPPVAIRLSPDGGTLAYISSQGDRLAIFTRRLDDLQPKRLEGTDDAISISFSPDGQWLAFLVGTQARKVPVNGGAAVAIPVQGGQPIAWIEWAGTDRFIVQAQGGLATLESDGTLRIFARPDSSRQEPVLALDQVLPSGWVLARSWRSPPIGPVMAIDPASGRRDTIIDQDVAWAGYADGMLVWTPQDGVLYGAPFDVDRRRLTGAGRALGGTVLSILGFSPPATIARGGLAYAPTRPRALARVARSGLATTLLATDRTYHNPRVSPDGRRLSLDFTDQVRDVWLFDIRDSTLTRFGFDSTAHDAEWLPDGSGLIFAAERRGMIGAFRRRFDGGASPDSIRLGPQQQLSLHAVAPDGRTGVGVVIEAGAFDVVAVSLDGAARFDTVFASRYNEGWPALSPDGRWLAYQSDESGRNEVYVRSWPTLGGKVQVSQNGGTEPAWSRDGRELFYRSGGGAEPMLVAAAFEPGPVLRVRSRTALFSVASYEFATPHRNYDPFPDGRSFAMVRQGQPGQLAEVVYVQNPRTLLERP
jgi:serine/threonine-protein kinase